MAAKHPYRLQKTILGCRNAFKAVAAEVARVAYHTFAFANPKDTEQIGLDPAFTVHDREGIAMAAIGRYRGTPSKRGA